MLPEYQAWLSSTSTLINLVTTDTSPVRNELNHVLNSKDRKYDGIPTHVIQKLYGMLNSVHYDWTNGFLRQIEYIIAAETFDDFLDHAEKYHKGNRKKESSVLASSVLEDSIKKICQKHSIDSKGKGLDELIDTLAARNIFNRVKSKRLKSCAEIRNKASHAEWDEFKIEDVGKMLKDIRDLVENYL